MNEEFIIQSNNIGKDYKIDFNLITENNKFNLPSILYIATLIPRKCHLDLLEALSKTDNLFNVNLVGDPIDKEILSYIRNKITPTGRNIESNINYFPKLSQRDLCNLLIHSSAYISTSINEGFGIPVLEANLYDIPIIIRDININRELFPNARFFKSNQELISIMSNIKKLSKFEIIERKKIASKISQTNIMNSFNYINLSQKLKSIIFDST